MTTLRVVAVLLLGGLLVGCASRGPRVDRTINTAGWKFARQDVMGAQSPGFDDSHWATVKLPHTWNALDGQDGGNDYYRGPGWYRLKLPIRSSDKHRNFFLRFEGAATVTDVYVNGEHAGQHRGNFAAFCFDITPLVRPGKDNVIAVRVDNSHQDDVAPLSGDFTIFGGIYRDVHLIVADPLGITPLDDASPGVYLKQTRVDDSSAEIDVTTKLRNGFDQPKNATVTCTVTDPRGKIVTQSESGPKQLAPRSEAETLQHISIPHPHLWDGRSDPYLYTATIEVKDRGQVVDRMTQPLGVRYFRLDPDQGFLLTGKRYALHGVNRHQDRINMGWAIGKAEHDEDFSFITEMGCTGVRLCHFQQADYAYEKCDQLGLVCWAENGLVNDVRDTQAFSDNIAQQTRELVKQNFNHPSILVWSLYNELALRRPDNPADAKIIARLNDLVHQLDPTRPTTAATHKQNLETPEIWFTDATAFNRYWGWYQGSPSEWGAGLDGLHAAKPSHPIGISEYGAGASVKQHELMPTTRPRTAGPWLPEEWQAIVHEAAWRAMKSRPYLWCQYIWVMFDFAADKRSEGDHMGRNDKGLVTADRKILKDAFYFYKANWNAGEPLIYITGRRFDPRPSGPQPIKVYSNAESVELILNGKSQGKRQGDTCVFTWPDAMLRDGENTVRAVGTLKNGRRINDTIRLHASRGATTRLGMPPTTATAPASVPATAP